VRLCATCVGVRTEPENFSIFGRKNRAFSLKTRVGNPCHEKLLTLSADPTQIAARLFRLLTPFLCTPDTQQALFRLIKPALDAF
jgi:hypothetical protein